MIAADTIRRVQRGDKEAYREIVSGCKDMAFNVAVSILKDEFLAKDAVQNAFVKAYLNIGTYRHEATFKTWFTRILIREAFQLMRSNRRRKQAEQDDAVQYDAVQYDASQHDAERYGADMTEASWGRGDDAGNRVAEDNEGLHDRNAYQAYHIQRAFDRLSAEDALTLKLFYLEDFSVREVVEVTGWSESSVKVKLHRSRNKMKSILSNTFKQTKEDLLS